MKLTQDQKIVTYILRHPQTQWWQAKDFMQQGMGEFNVGYEASSRLSGLTKNYPNMFETRTVGRFREVKIRRAHVSEWFDDLTKPLRITVAMELNYYPQKPVEDPQPEPQTTTLEQTTLI